MSKEPLPPDIKRKIISSGQERYGDKTVYSHQQQLCYGAGADFGYSLAASEISLQKAEIESHLTVLRDLQRLIDRYRKTEPFGSNKCGNHVYNNITEHLAKHNL